MTSYFVDSAGGNDLDSGGIGDPWADINFAITQYSPGDALNVRSNNPHTLDSAPTWTDGTVDAPVIVRGYTTTENDGGHASILPNGFSFVGTGANYIAFVDLGFSGTLSGAWFNAGSDCRILRCSADMSGGASYGFRVSNYGYVAGCSIFGGSGPQDLLTTGAYSYAYGNFLECDGGSSASGLIGMSSGGKLIKNVIVLSGDTGAMQAIVELDGFVNAIHSNTFFASAGSAKAGVFSPSGSRAATIFDNIFAGFSLTGGKAINIDAASYDTAIMRNAFWDNDTDISYGGGLTDDYANESIGSNPFAAVGDPTDPADVLTYFAPQNVDNVLTGGTFGQHKGAIAPASGGGGSTLIVVDD